MKSVGEVFIFEAQSLCVLHLGLQVTILKLQSLYIEFAGVCHHDWLAVVLNLIKQINGKNCYMYITYTYIIFSKNAS